MLKKVQPNRLTNKTSFSKVFTTLLFIFLPIIAFLMGISYQKKLNDRVSIMETKNQLRNVRVERKTVDASSEAMIKEATPASGTKSAR